MKLIDLLIRLYPEEFRARYGRAMRDFHHERLREGNPSVARIAADHVTSATAEHMHSVIQDVRYALRGLARRPAFAAVVLATIALGVGANAAIFSVVNGILLRPLPYREPERLVAFGHKPPHWLISEAEYVDYKRDVQSFEAFSVYTQSEGNLATAEEPERIAQAVVTRDFFATLGVQPMIGRQFADDEDRVRPATVAIISHDLWQRRFAGDSTIVGQKIQYNGSARTVVGVMPKNFDFPSSRTDVWLPMLRFRMDSIEVGRSNHFLFGVARVKRGIPIQRVATEAITVSRRIMQAHPNDYSSTAPLIATTQSVGDMLVGATRPYLWALLGAVAFVLLIVCANVANLLLARGESRRKEMALRTALGATRSRLTAQLLTECTVLAIGGGVLGLVLAWAGQRALIAAAPASIPRLDEITLDWTVVLYAAVLSIVTGLVFGLVPTLRAAREAPAESLKAGGKTAQQGGSRRVRRTLVVAEVALAVVMLSGAGMLLRSLVNLQSADLGFDSQSVLTAKVSPPLSMPEERATLLYSQLLERVRAMPGVQSAGAAGWLPVVDAGGLWGVMAEGKTHLPAQMPAAVPQQATTGYFKAMGMPIVSGRDFTDADRAGGPYSVIISKAAAKMLWPEANDALGKRMRVGGDSTWMTVVGVVNDIRARGFSDTPEPTMYFPYPQTHETAYFMPRSMNLVVRTSGDPMLIANRVRATVRELDASVPVSYMRTLEQVVGTSVANRRFSTALIASFAALALLLAGIGIFGVISYGVSERRFEIGVRMALGAERSRVLRLVVSDGVRMALVGIVIGLAGAAALARAIKSMLVGVPTIDIPTWLAVSAALAIVAVAASILPARRAMAVNPTEALRSG
jgi:putative ABC transport system permease protein